MDRERKSYCGKGMHPCAVRLINKELARLGRGPIAPGDRNTKTITEVLDELASLKKEPTPLVITPLFTGSNHV